VGGGGVIAGILWALVGVFNGVVLLYFVLVNAFYLGTSLIAFRVLRRYSQRLKSLDVEELIATAGAPPITLIATAYNERATCVESVRSLLTLSYADYEILVVNDGSSDDTVARLAAAFELEPAPRAPTAALPTRPVGGVYRSRRHPNLWVIDKENGRKADALNAGLNYCRTPLFCAIDADSLLEREALSRVVRPFLEDTRVIAVGGIIRVVNGCTVQAGMVTDVRLPRSWLARFQVVEYLRAFLAGRMGWSAIRGMLIISGAFGLFRRSIVVEAGGYAHDTVGEDMELVVRLHRFCHDRRLSYRIEFIPDPVAWTQVPEHIRDLARQRDRWQRGLADVLMRHLRLLLNPRFGVLGLLAFPYFFFLEMLGAAVEVGGYVTFALVVAAHRAKAPYIAAFLMLAVVLGITLSIAAVGLEELGFRRYRRVRDLLAMFALAAVEGFGYRQLNTLWRARGLWSALRGRKGWGEMTRQGFTMAAR
jgi:cellulose synthase/poly-beta-1,6-N-acetylglucosamine synthase-like glycosyltransferase